MPAYYVKTTGIPEVHQEGCLWLPVIKQKTQLGIFTDCKEAIQNAKAIYNEVNPCSSCCSSQKTTRTEDDNMPSSVVNT